MCRRRLLPLQRRRRLGRGSPRSARRRLARHRPGLRALRRDARVAADAVGRHGTGHNAAVCADVRPGSTVAVVGDGAVGLSDALAAKRLGAGRIIALSRNPDRQEVAREFGATDVIEQRGDDATEAVMALTEGVGVDATLECVGTGQAMQTALSIARPGSMVGYVGVPHGVELPIGDMFLRNKGIRGGSAPARAYMMDERRAIKTLVRVGTL